MNERNENEIVNSQNKKVDAAPQTLVEFLLSNDIIGIEKEVDIGGRLKGFKFKIKPMNNKEFGEAQKQSFSIMKKKASFDQRRFFEIVILNNCLYPNFRDAAFISKCGVVTPEACLNKVLLAGEISDLAQAIISLSGFDNDIESDIEDVKNS